MEWKYLNLAITAVRCMVQTEIDNVRNLLRRQEPLRKSVCSFLPVRYMIFFHFFLSFFFSINLCIGK